MVKLFLRAEALAVLVGGLAIWMSNDGSPGWLLVLIFVPDLSMVGYAAGSRIGALSYNFTHNLATAAVCLGAGWVMHSRTVLLIGALLLVHIGMDRTLGYGLKLTSGFRDTHLGRIGRMEYASERP